MGISVLGPVAIDGEAGFLGPRDRVALAALALRPGEAVQTDQLVDALWATHPPATADKVVQGCIVRLRKRLGPAAIQTTPSGYRLTLPPDGVDATRFERLLAEGRAAMAAGRPAQAAETLTRGLALWRGRPFTELEAWPPGAIEAVRLVEVRLDAEEDHLHAVMASGRHREVVAMARARAEAAPLRERRWLLLAEAQHRAGRQGDALRTIHRARAVVRELGLDPGAELVALERQVLLGGPLADQAAPALVRAADGEHVASGLPPLLRFTAALPLSGREAERAALWDAWSRCREGGFATVLVAGEPGIGKTRLVAEVAGDARADGAAILAGGCNEELRIPFGPFVGALRWMVEHSPVDVLPDRLGKHPGDLVPLVPELVELVPGISPSAAADGDTERYRLFEAVCSWLGSCGRSTPTVLVLDDLHWADTGTVLLLRHLVSAAPEGLLVLGTYRDTDVTRTHPLSAALADLRSAASVTRMVLSGLSETGVRQLIERARGRPLDDAGVSFAAMVRDETSGNPLFVGEVLRHLIESGAPMACDRGSTSGLDLAAVGIPDGITEVIGRRLSRLPRGTESLLRAAAVIGSEFDMALLGAVVDRTDVEVLDQLEHAVAAALVTEVGVDQFRFAHALVRDTLHAELTASRRARAHRRVAQVLEQRHADDLDSVAAAIAVHWNEACAGGDATLAAHWAARAGEHDLARRAPDEAARWFTVALDLLGDHDRDRGRRQHLLSRLAHAQSRTNAPAAGATANCAAALALEAGDVGAAAHELCRWIRKGYHSDQQADEHKIALLERTLGLVDDGDPHLRGRVLAHLASELIFIGDSARRDRLIDELRQLIDVTDDPVRRWHLMSGGTVGPDRRWSDRDTLEKVRRYCYEALPHLADDFDRVEVQELVWPLSAALGDRDGCDRALVELSEEASPAAELSHDFFAATTAALDGRLLDYQRQIDEIVRGLESARHPRVITYWWSANFTAMREHGTIAELRALSDRWDADHRPLHRSATTVACDAIQHLLAGDHDLISLDGIDPDGIADDGGRGSILAFTAEVAAAVGDEPLVRQLLRLVEPFHGMHLITRAVYWGPYDRLAGLLRDRLGDDELADQAFARAVAANQALRTPVWLARTELDWAESLTRRGRRHEATALLAHARAVIGALPLADSRQRADALALRLS